MTDDEENQEYYSDVSFGDLDDWHDDQEATVERTPMPKKNTTVTNVATTSNPKKRRRSEPRTMEGVDSRSSPQESTGMAVHDLIDGLEKGLKETVVCYVNSKLEELDSETSEEISEIIVRNSEERGAAILSRIVDWILEKKP